MRKLLFVLALMFLSTGGIAKMKDQTKARLIDIKTDETVKIASGLSVKLRGVSHKITEEGDIAMIELQLIDKKSPESETVYLMERMEWKWEGYTIRLIYTDESCKPRTAQIEVKPSQR